MLSHSTSVVTVVPEYTFMCIIHRPCCMSPVDVDRNILPGICNTCGFTWVHRLHRHGIRHFNDPSRSLERFRYYLGTQDYFGNNAIHCAAASGNVHVLRQAIEIANDSCIYATNTSGQIFVHLLRCSTFMEIEVFAQILKDVDTASPCAKKFLLYRRDYHGRTILHQMFQNAPDEVFNHEPLQSIFDTTELDIYAADNFGVMLLQILIARANSTSDLSLGALLHSQAQSSSYHDGLPALAATGAPASVQNDGQPCFSYRLLFSDPTLCSSYQLQHRHLMEMLDAGIDINWIDSDGNTPLTAIIKYWMDDNAELPLRATVIRLLENGSEIHMRDRSGNTALAAATAREFRAVIKALLVAEANLHGRNYAGDGILMQAIKWKRFAKMEKNEKLYTRIWSSMLLLIDNGAKYDPTDLDEWMSTSGKEEFPRRAPGSAPISISKRV